jgi:hypothetical protein
VGGPPVWGMDGGLTTLPRKTQYLLRITTHSLGTGRGSGQGPVAGCCECGDESSGSCATELVINNELSIVLHRVMKQHWVSRVLAVIL